MKRWLLALIFLVLAIPAFAAIKADSPGGSGGNGTDNTKLPLGGGTLTGPLTISGSSITAVDALFTGGITFGGTDTSTNTRVWQVAGSSGQAMSMFAAGVDASTPAWVGKSGFYSSTGTGGLFTVGSVITPVLSWSPLGVGISTGVPQFPFDVRTTTIPTGGAGAAVGSAIYANPIIGAVTTTDVLAGIYSHLISTGAPNMSTGHLIGIIGRTTDTINVSADMYGVEGRVDTNQTSGHIARGVLGLAQWIGTAASTMTIIGVEGRASARASDGGVASATCTLVNFYSQSQVGGNCSGNNCWSILSVSTSPSRFDGPVCLNTSISSLARFTVNGDQFNIGKLTTSSCAINGTGIANAQIMLGLGVSNSTMAVTAGGNVGIGTTAPAAKLHAIGADDSTVFIASITAVQASITTNDTFMSFNSNTGQEGSIAGTGAAGVLAYNTFLGSHWTHVEGPRPVIGMVLDMTGAVMKGHGERLAMTEVSKVAKSRRVYGVYGGTDKEGRDSSFGLGAGIVMVGDRNGNIKAGDLLESDGFGYAQKQDDDIIRSSTLGKAIVDVDWSKEKTKLKIIGCVLYAGG